MSAPRPNVFEGLALDRAGEHRENPDWLAAAWQRARVVEVDFEGRARAGGTPAGLLSRAAAEIAERMPEAACFLGLQDATPWFALPAWDSLDEAAGGIGLREAAARLSAFDAGLFAYAKALLLWHTRARYCGACGDGTESTRAGHCRRCRNEQCKLEHYPRTDAAVIVLVTDGERALIGRGAGWGERRYSTLAGFVEPGESLEDALRREVHEEAGVRVGACRYRSSQPWPFPASLMVGFRAEAVDPTIHLGDELADARWISAEQLLAEVARGDLLVPPSISVSFRLIAEWLLEQLPADRVRAVIAEA